MDERLDKVEELIENQELEKAQEILDSVTEKSGRKYYLQGKLFIQKNWYSEARKQFKFAVKAEPDNPEYKQALDDLDSFRNSKEFRKVKQMGNSSDFAEACCLCGCECCGTGVCEAICNGCS